MEDEFLYSAVDLQYEILLNCFLVSFQLIWCRYYNLASSKITRFSKNCMELPTLVVFRCLYFQILLPVCSKLCTYHLSFSWCASCLLFSFWYWLKYILWAGLYVTTSGFDSEILSLQRKFGQWRDDGSSEEHSDLLFYEHVEAVKLTGDNLMPAGQVW
jgi:hypothetical protein